MVSVVAQNGQTPLIYAVRYHHTETVKVLLAARADVNLQEKVNKTKAIYVDNATCVYHSHSCMSTSHFLENLSAQVLSVHNTQNLECLKSLFIVQVDTHVYCLL